VYRPNSVVVKFLIAIAAWNLGTGAFNPFFNAFFARLRMPVQQIGSVFSSAQFTQAGAVLLAPLVFRRFGLTRGVSGMQLATAFALVGLASAVDPGWSAVAYTAYVASQYMSEPGMYAFLMDSVPEGERSGASALNFLVASMAQAVAAAAGGLLIARFGYSPVLVAAALISVLAAILFRTLLRGNPPPAASDP
ncbi:MAG: MFS transporter, partial [Bryobacteraceae bacterium]